MAKKKAAARKKLLPQGTIVVKSRTYGEHTRAVRGSKTPVELNQSFAEHNAKTVAINRTAKRVHDLMKHCGAHFKEAMLWQVMLSRMRKGTADDRMSLLLTLKGLELNGKYKLDRFAHPNVRELKWNEKGCEMIVSNGYPHWKHGDTEYCYEVFLLLLGKDAQEDGLMSEVSGWTQATDKEGEMRFAFCVPHKSAYYLVCLHFMTGRNGKETGTLASRGMQIVAVGKGTG